VAPYRGLFERVLARALENGTIHEGADLEVVAQVLGTGPIPLMG